MVARREAVDIVIERVALVQVLDGRAEIDGIGRVGCQILFKFDNYRFVFQFDVGFLAHRRRNHHVLVGVI